MPSPNPTIPKFQSRITWQYDTLYSPLHIKTIPLFSTGMLAPLVTTLLLIPVASYYTVTSDLSSLKSVQPTVLYVMHSIILTLESISYFAINFEMMVLGATQQLIII